MIRRAPSFLFVLITIGCAHLQPGPINAISAPPPAQRPGHVYLIRGFHDWYSDGINRLADELRRDGVDAQVFAESQWEDVGQRLVQSRGPGDHEPLVLIGFSYGADDVVRISRELTPRRVSVDLLVTIDPVTPDAVPANVRRSVNFYQPNGVMDVFPFLRGIPLHREPGDAAPLKNVNVRAEQDLAEPNTSHATIAASPRIHRAIEQLVVQTCAAPSQAIGEDGR